MRTIGKRLERLERTFAPLVNKEANWGRMARFRDELLRNAEHRSAAAVAQLKKEMDERGPLGLWFDVARSHLRDHGFVQTDHESFAETMARALGIDSEQLKACIAQGQIGAMLVNRFKDSQGAR